MNKSASLTAGVCSLCITATMVAVPPHAAAADVPAVQHRNVSVLDQPYELTAASVALQNLLLVAGIPFNNLNTTLTTLGGLTNFVTGLNQALGNIYKGNWNLVPANLQKAWTDEVAAFQKVLQLPQTLITYNVQALQHLFGGLSPASVTSTFVTSERVHTLALPSAAAAIEGGTPEKTDESPAIEVTGSTPLESGTETAVAVDPAVPGHETVTAPTDTVDEVHSTVPAEDTAIDSPVADAPQESIAPVAEKPKPSEEPKPSEKPAAADTDHDVDTDTDDTDPAHAAATYGKHALKGGVSGKHSRTDDASDSGAASASTQGTSTASTPGRHRKAETASAGSASAGSASAGSASSTGSAGAAA